ncbi:MAG TPA: amidohydrolase family protein, partial [Kofleriaceae bacterium]|nr:amidohydrolase family protein [Kofleriaceae bacterium]
MRLRKLIPVLTAALAACVIADESATGAFDDDENDDTLGVDNKADESGTTGPMTYRSGCGTPIRTGTYILHGDVVLPTGVARGYFVTINGEKIQAIGPVAPAQMPFIETNGYIFPGLIDGHGHVEYNHIPLADLGKRYQDRDQWPGATKYKTLVKAPKNAVTDGGAQCEALRHGEARALVGGTTAIQGTPQTACARSLVRNIEGVNFCQDRIRQNVTGISGFSRAYGGKISFTQSIKNDLAANKLDAFVVHAGEGIDEHARSEWDQLVAQGLNVPELVMIHTTAFGPKEYSAAAASGAKVIWSPLSNLLLYGRTADVPAAMQAGLLVSLGSDWAPSGSANLLSELKVADHVNQKLWAGYITDEQLVDMVTINPATTFGWDRFVGSIEVGKYADLMVVAKQPDKSPYRSLIEAHPQDVMLVTISGDPLFGTPALMDSLGKAGDYEVIDACGSPRAIDMTVTAKDV